MKKIVFFFFAFVLYTGTISAQSAQELTDNLDQMVELTDAQEDQILQINQTKLAEIAQFKAAQNWTARKNAALDRIAQVRGVLSHQQQVTLDQAKNNKSVARDF